MEQVFAIEGFGQEAHPREINLDIDRAHQDTGYGVAAPAEPACQRGTVKARHPHIRQHQIDVVHLKLIYRLQAVRYLPHRIALVLQVQEIRHHFSNSRLVCNDQDRWR